jgi:hypothetical protein
MLCSAITSGLASSLKLARWHLYSDANTSPH